MSESTTVDYNDTIVDFLLHQHYISICAAHGRQQLQERLKPMIIESSSLFGWLVAAVGGVISVLAGMAIWNNRARFKGLDERLKTVENRLNNNVSNDVKRLDTKITVVEGGLEKVNTKLDLISESVIQRMDKLERDLPGLIEAGIYRTMLAKNSIQPVNQDPRP